MQQALPRATNAIETTASVMSRQRRPLAPEMKTVYYPLQGGIAVCAREYSTKHFLPRLLGAFVIFSASPLAARYWILLRGF